MNKKRTGESPRTVRVVFTLPADRAEPVEEGLDALQEIVGADPHSYPKGHLLEAARGSGCSATRGVGRYFNGTEPYLKDADVTLYHGDALEILRTLPDRSVHMCATSPPFYGLRDYGTGTWGGGDPDMRPQEASEQQGGLPGLKLEAADE